MYSNAPEGYDCPICIGLAGEISDRAMIRSTDIVYRDDIATALINSFFIKGNEGHVIVVPNNHIENIYNLPNEVGHRILEVSKKIAIVLKQSYSCNGITVLQNNEPASEQHAFHYHMHIIPRYDQDEFHNNRLTKLTPSSEERRVYAEKVKKYL